MKKLYSLVTLFVVCLVFCCTLVSYAQSPQCTDFTYQGENYSVGRMGGHCWMKTNLKANLYSDGVVVPFARPYLGNPEDAATYGLLYDWASASRQSTPAANVGRVQGVCPTGWVLPVAADYAMLNDSVGTEGLVSAEGWFEGYGTSTASGFNALPAGYCTDAGRFLDRGLKAYFWTSGATVATATACGFSFDCPTMLTEEKARNYGFSVRCILDSALAVLSITSNPASDTVSLCGESSVQVTYIATVSGETPTSYSWNVTGGTGDGSTTDTLVVTAGAGTINVTCTAAGVSATKSTTVTAGTVPALGLCEECFNDSIQVKVKTNVASIVWRNSSNDSISNSLTGLKKSATIPAGVYTAIAKSSDGCTVSRSATLGNGTAHPCTVASKNSNELGSTAATIDSVYDHQGNWYRVVETGTGANKQCWLAENMRCTTSPKGNLTAGGESCYKAYYYDYSTATQFSLRERGYLYNWAGAIDTNGIDYITASFNGRRGICPEGWHLPTDSEWKTLEGGYLTEPGGTTAITSSTLDLTSSYRGNGAGKFTGGCDWSTSSSTTAPGNYSYSDRNTTGFSALPAGYYIGSGYFINDGKYANFWSSTSESGTYALRRYFYFSNEGVYRSQVSKSYGHSVRCLRDEEVAINDTITFVPNGGANTMPQQVVTRGESTTLNTNAFTHDGNWQFRGWSTNGTDSVAYTNQANITTNGNDTLYAVWHTWCTGTAKSNELGTSRIDSVKDHQDNWYKVVEIGTGANKQCWLKENMRATKSPSTGNTIVMNPMVKSYSSKSAGYYNNNEATYGKYGVLYNWCAAVDTFYAAGSKPELANASGHGSSDWSCAALTNRRGICPEGWHIPTDAEWSTLATAAGCTAAYSGTGLGKLTGGCDWSTSSSTTAPGNYSYSERNSSGFSARPAGYSKVSFYSAGNEAYFWSSTPSGTSWAIGRIFSYNSDSVGYYTCFRSNGFSVRCVRNN